ncbi:MAG: hypothetical protein MUE44_21015 [Oscillatoriaceae cyanobacterium Prado104]|nr:hypothetical protein [Oscillatoriaceae cyanobacterium Prado104]
MYNFGFDRDSQTASSRSGRYFLRRRNKEEGRRKKEEGRRKREEGRRKK